MHPARTDADDRIEGAADRAAREPGAGAGPPGSDHLQRVADERERAADARDSAAQLREDAALQRRDRAAQRDVAAAARDRLSRELTRDADPGFASRFLSARDVDASAGDRADALHDERLARDDRDHARDDRRQAAEDRTIAAHEAALAGDKQQEDLKVDLAGQAVIGQAQGLVMAALHISAEAALAQLHAEANATGIPLGDIAERIVREAH